MYINNLYINFWEKTITYHTLKGAWESKFPGFMREQVDGWCKCKLY